MERNIRTITRLRLQIAHEWTVQARLTDVITSFSGSMLFVYLHKRSVHDQHDQSPYQGDFIPVISPAP
jgi:hypothetical protein